MYKTVAVDSVDFGAFDSNMAKKIFRQMNYRSTYNGVYGDKPKTEDDFICLKKKKFRDLAYSQFFTKEATQYIEKWLEINDAEEFLKRIFIAIRDMHTVIKNFEIPATTTSSFFLPKLKEASKPPRFDKIISAVKYADVIKSNRSQSI